MKCPDFETLMLLLDGELPADRMNEVSLHVHSCERCSRITSSQNNIETSWRDGFKSPVTDRFRELEQTVFDSLRFGRKRRWTAVLPVAAAIAAVLLGIKLILSEKPSFDSVTRHSLYRDVEDASSIEQRTETAQEYPAAGLEEFQSVAECEEIEDADIDELEVVSMQTGAAPVDRETGEEFEESDGTVMVSEECITPDEMSTTDPFSGLSPDAPDYGEVSVERGMIGGITEGDNIGYLATTAGAGGGASAGGAGEELHSSSVGSISYTDVTSDEDQCEFEGVSVDSNRMLESPEEPVSSEDSEPAIFMSDDAVGLATASTVCSGSEQVRNDIFESDLPCEASTAQDTSGLSLDFQSEFYVELVFKSNGEPDSLTALLLDSLIPCWYEYIPFELVDTVLVIPVAEIHDLLIDGDYSHVEAIQ